MTNHAAHFVVDQHFWLLRVTTHHCRKQSFWVGPHAFKILQRNCRAPAFRQPSFKNNPAIREHDSLTASRAESAGSYLKNGSHTHNNQIDKDGKHENQKEVTNLSLQSNTSRSPTPEKNLPMKIACFDFTFSFTLLLPFLDNHCNFSSCHW